MYQFSGKLKLASIILILIGLLGIGYGFWKAPSTLEEAKEIIAHQTSHGDDHGNSHGEKKEVHKNEHDSKSGAHENKLIIDNETSAHDSHNDDAHAEHVFHQMQNKPWSAFYVSLFFFLGISLLVLAFYAAQRVAQSGWSVVLFRVMEAISANLVPTSIIMLLVILSASVLHVNHMFPWMAEGTFDPTSPNYDAIVDGKSWWINVPGWTIRGIFIFYYGMLTDGSLERIL